MLRGSTKMAEHKSHTERGDVSNDWDGHKPCYEKKGRTHSKDKSSTNL